MAAEAVGTSLYRPAEPFPLDQQHPRGVEGIEGGLPLVIYPEGGRTPDGEIKPFLAGAFFLAIKAQVDIVPVALVGTYELLPMNTYHIKCRPLEMRVGEPIATAGLTMRIWNRFRHECRRQSKICTTAEPFRFPTPIEATPPSCFHRRVADSAPGRARSRE